MVVERTPLVVTGAYRPVPPKRSQQQLGRGQGPSQLVTPEGARGHGHPPPDGLDPLELSAPAARHDDLGQGCCGTQWAQNLRAV